MAVKILAAVKSFMAKALGLIDCGKAYIFYSGYTELIVLVKILAAVKSFMAKAQGLIDCGKASIDPSLHPFFNFPKSQASHIKLFYRSK